LGLGWWIWGALASQLAAANRRADASETEAGELRRALEALEQANPGKPAAAATKAEPRGVAPRLLEEANEGAPDDLKKIKGIGPALEEILHGFGVYYYKQIADWTADNILWFDDRLAPKGRVTRDKWAPQAKALMAEQKSPPAQAEEADVEIIADDDDEVDLRTQDAKRSPGVNGTHPPKAELRETAPTA
ncbi:MAG: hypothetical protein AAGL49_06265, partial [Pseudomonadota bacterium]